MHHYMTFYEENGVRYVESWLQINVFNKCYCFSKLKRKVKRPEKTIYLDGQFFAECLASTK